ncbi:MAG: folate-binding protein [Methylococcaceae bacterium]|nr:folate-binding protein [Methylococcaceae bacterium]
MTTLMNADWIDFLKSNNASFLENSEIGFDDNQQAQTNAITALAHFSTLKITGSDAAAFLQGQLTCNINDLTENNSFFAAFCNAKGQTISTLLILKLSSSFLIVLPTDLIDKVTQKLQMYIMRSDVQMHNLTDELCTIGLNTQTSTTLPSLPETSFAVSQNKQIFIKLPLHSNRYLVISNPQNSISLWSDLTSNAGFTPCNSNTWVDQDISAGIPWLNQATSEKYIPQMLNIDKLGGISFTKGCYTGQEIVARTHYLGKTKRELFLALCNNKTDIPVDTQIFINNSEQTIGKVLSLLTNNQQTKMLTVMQSTDIDLKSLILNNSNQDKISIIDFQ